MVFSFPRYVSLDGAQQPSLFWEQLMARARGGDSGRIRNAIAFCQRSVAASLTLEAVAT